MSDTKPESVKQQICSKCNENKNVDKFYKNRSICYDCNNNKRRERYKNDEEHRQKLIKMACEYKHKRMLERQQLKKEEQNKIGIDNKLCKYCRKIKHKDRFRHNRMKCRDCERDEPVEKFKRYVRTRIYTCLRHKNKTKHSIEYLGCSSECYFNWMFSYDNNFNLDNHGKEWHIDHVIPLSKFDLNSEHEQFLAFNWRNTMPLSCTENMSKNNKIIKEQIELHYKKLIDYHTENKLDLPQVFIDLFAKHLDAGTPLEPLLPL